MSPKPKTVGLVLIVAIAGAFVLIGNASAATPKTLTYEQAWTYCKALLDKQRTPATTTSNDRYYRGSACMKHFGHQI